VSAEGLAEGDLEFDVCGFFLATEPGAEDLVALGGGEGGFDAFAHGIAIGAFAEFFVLEDDEEDTGVDRDGFGDGAGGEELGFADDFGSVGEAGRGSVGVEVGEGGDGEVFGLGEVGEFFAFFESFVEFLAGVVDGGGHSFAGFLVEEAGADLFFHFSEFLLLRFFDGNEFADVVAFVTFDGVGNGAFAEGEIEAFFDEGACGFEGLWSGVLGEGGGVFDFEFGFGSECFEFGAGLEGLVSEGADGFDVIGLFLVFGGGVFDFVEAFGVGEEDPADGAFFGGFEGVFFLVVGFLDFGVFDFDVLFEVIEFEFDGGAFEGLVHGGVALLGGEGGGGVVFGDEVFEFGEADVVFDEFEEVAGADAIGAEHFFDHGGLAGVELAVFLEGGEILHGFHGLVIGGVDAELLHLFFEDKEVEGEVERGAVAGFEVPGSVHEAHGELEHAEAGGDHVETLGAFGLSPGVVFAVDGEGFVGAGRSGVAVIGASVAAPDSEADDDDEGEEPEKGAAVTTEEFEHGIKEVGVGSEIGGAVCP
jgi:hypothetical protein